MSKSTEEITAEILAAAARESLLIKQRSGEELGQELAAAFKVLHTQVRACMLGKSTKSIMEMSQ